MTSLRSSARRTTGGSSMYDTTATVEAPQGEVVGRFRMSVIRGESTPASDELWNSRADALAQWLIAQRQRRRVTAEGREPERAR